MFNKDGTHNCHIVDPKRDYWKFNPDPVVVHFSSWMDKFGEKGFFYFILGLASFLVAQIVYSFLFLRTINLSGKLPFLKKKPYWLIAYMAFGLILYIILYNHLDGVLKIAVFACFPAISCTSLGTR